MERGGRSGRLGGMLSGAPILVAPEDKCRKPGHGATST